jgi:hypothetical protein
MQEQMCKRMCALIKHAFEHLLWDDVRAGVLSNVRICMRLLLCFGCASAHVRKYKRIERCCCGRQ